VFMDDIRVLPKDVQYRIKSAVSQALSSSEREKYQARMIADYIAGMTDRFAISEYEKLFNPLTLT